MNDCIISLFLRRCNNQRLLHITGLLLTIMSLNMIVTTQQTSQSFPCCVYVVKLSNVLRNHDQRTHQWKSPSFYWIETSLCFVRLFFVYNVFHFERFFFCFFPFIGSNNGNVTSKPFCFLLIYYSSIHTSYVVRSVFFGLHASQCEEPNERNAEQQALTIPVYRHWMAILLPTEWAFELVNCW